MKGSMTRPECCGQPMLTPEEAGLRPGAVFSDASWTWTTEEVAYVCSICGAHILKAELDLFGEKEEEKEN